MKLVFPKCDPVAIPEELKLMERFCLWRYETVNGVAGRKVPYNPVTLSRAQVSNPDTFCSFDEAMRTQGKGFDGLGIGMFGDLGAIDIDHCIGADGKLSDLAESVVGIMDSYTEVSPSGEGIRILFYAPSLTFDTDRFYTKHSKIGLELYVGSKDNRYVTITGNVLRDLPVASRTDEALAVVHLYMQKPSEAPVAASIEQPSAIQPKSSGASQAPSSRSVGQISDAELIDIAKRSKNGAKFSSLWSGDWQSAGNYPSQSEADFALCCLLAYWTDKDIDRMDSLFRQSGLMRDKWERHTKYRMDTLRKAISMTTDVFRPNDPSRVFTNLDEAEQQPQQTPEDEKAEVLSQSAASQMDAFLAEVQRNTTQKAISSGFALLDEKLGGGLYPGLYFVGAVSSLGKTSLVLQIADQIASTGQHVLFFSLEMSKWELMAKSISRLTYAVCKAQHLDKSYAKTTRGILNGGHGSYQMNMTELNVIRQAREQYKATSAKGVWFYEGVGNIGVNEIRVEVEKHIRATGCSPVVIVDYVQIIAPAEVRASDKQNTDKNVLELKRLSRDLNIPIIGISSLNRDNYYQPINMTAFKESGSLEYGSDVLIGLQYAGMDSIAKLKKESEKTETLQRMRTINQQKAERGEPIDIELKILKNRNGSRDVKIKYGFVPMFNTFIECDKAAEIFHDISPKESGDVI